MSDRTKDLIVERVLAERPWRNPAFSLGYFIRRWMLSLWVVALCAVFAFPIALSVALVAAAIAIDVTWTGRAFDLQISHREFVAALAEPRRLGRYGRTELIRFYRNLGLLVMIPLVLAATASLAALLVPPSFSHEIVSCFMLACGVVFAVWAAYVSAEGVESSLGGFEGKSGDFFVSRVVWTANLHFEDLIPHRLWVSLQHLFMTIVGLLSAAICAFCLWTIYVEDMGKPLTSIGLALVAYLLLYLMPAGMISAFWSYRARLLLQCIRDAQRVSPNATT